MKVKFDLYPLIH